MRGALVVGMCLLAMVAGCRVDLAGKDRCQIQDDCVLGGICRDGRCLAATATGALDAPADTRPDAPPPPPDTQPDVDPVALPDPQPDGPAQAAEAPDCRPELTCCEPCTQGCAGTACRIDIAGDDWRDFDTDGMSAGHTLSIQQIGSFFRARYTSGPREGLEHDGRFLDQHAIDLGGVPGEVRTSRLIVFFSGEWRR